MIGFPLFSTLWEVSRISKISKFRRRQRIWTVLEKTPLYHKIPFSDADYSSGGGQACPTPPIPPEEGKRATTDVQNGPCSHFFSIVSMFCSLWARCSHLSPVTLNPIIHLYRFRRFLCLRDSEAYWSNSKPGNPNLFFWSAQQASQVAPRCLGVLEPEHIVSMGGPKGQKKTLHMAKNTASMLPF